MLAARQALGLVRAELRAEVLAHLDKHDDHTRSVLIAALGVIGELTGRICDDEQWCKPSVLRLREAAKTWPGHLAGLPDTAERVADKIRASRTAASLAAERAALLDAAEDVLVAVWSRDSGDTEHALRREVLELLAADVKLEVGLE